MAWFECLARVCVCGLVPGGSHHVHSVSRIGSRVRISLSFILSPTRLSSSNPVSVGHLFRLLLLLIGVAVSVAVESRCAGAYYFAV